MDSHVLSDDLSLRLITWNVADAKPPKDFTELLNLSATKLPNLYGIGLQEMSVRPKQLASDYIYNDMWTNEITKLMVTRNYIRLKTLRLMGMHLSVYARKEDLVYITNIEVSYTRTGLGGIWGNKGGVSIRMDICGVNLCIVNCHFAAHEQNVGYRLADYDMIVDTQSFREIPTILDHDYVFWMGDLNFRIEDLPKKEIESRLEAKDYDYLLKHDQLKRCMEDELILLDFKEPKIEFPCTYKYNKGTNNYDSSKKQRKASWCDRILYKSQDESFDGVSLGVTCCLYTSVDSYTISDHKPVVADFTIKVMKHPPMLPLMFEPMDRWNSTIDIKCSYTVAREDYEVTAWDWIGLYKACYKHDKDYVTYVWAPTRGEDMGDGTDMFEITFQKDYLRNLNGSFCLCYYSAERDCMIGYSDIFKISESDDYSTSDESLPFGAVGGADEDFDSEDDDYDASRTDLRHDDSNSDDDDDDDDDDE